MTSWLRARLGRQADRSLNPGLCQPGALGLGIPLPAPLEPTVQMVTPTSQMDTEAQGSR